MSISETIFADLYINNKAKLTRLAYSITSDFQRAEEVVQEVFLKLFKHDFSKIDGCPEAWLWVVCKTTSLKCLKKNNRYTTLGGFFDSVDGDELRPTDPSEIPAIVNKSNDINMCAELYASPLTKICEDEYNEASASFMSEALAKLSPKHQQVLKLRFFSELGYNEIAEQTGLSIGNVGFILNDAKIKLNQLCRKHYEISHDRKSKDRYKFKRGAKTRVADSVQSSNKRRPGSSRVR